MKRASGFTLLEVMVVVVIIATIVSFAVFSIGDGGREHSLTEAAKRLVLVSDLSGQQAVIAGKPIAVQIRENGYEFKIFEAGEWHPHHNGRLFKRYQFSSDIVVQPYLTDNVTNYRSRPDDSFTMVFLPDGERLLREVTVTDLHSDNLFTLQAIDGSYEIIRAEQ